MDSDSVVALKCVGFWIGVMAAVMYVGMAAVYAIVSIVSVVVRISVNPFWG